jgi:L-rhamnose mutarotase
MDDLSVIKPGEKFYICAYRIDNTGMLPFIQYCFHKDKTDTLSFPVLRSDGKTSVDKQGTKFINHIFKQSPGCSFFTRIREGHNYLFYNVDYNRSKSQFMLKKSQWWWALMTEIVNYQKLITFTFAPNVHPIFINNPSLIYLKDERNNIIEIPEVGFHGTYFNLLNFISNYGLRPSTLNSMMGPYYYFGTFRKAVRYAGWTSTYKPREIDGKVVTDSEGRYNRGGIVRFAMFLGKTKVFLNQPNERDDFSESVRMKIKEQPRSEKWERLVIKLHDHNGLWAEEYDSCYVGRVKLANGGLFMKNPEFILKHFEQQHMLTSHELDKSTLKRNWDGNYEGYNIL